MGKFSDLTDDLLLLILEKLANSGSPKLAFRDCIRFGAVCVSWNLILREMSLLNPQYPWLMLPGDNRESAKFFSLSDKKMYKLTLPSPPIRNRIIYGSSHGWLITVDDTSQMQLLNPITSVQIQLPPLDTLPFVDAARDSQGRVTEFTVRVDLPKCLAQTYTFKDMKEMRDFFFQKAILSSAPSNSDYNSSSSSAGSDFTVMIIHGPASRLAFTKAGHKTWSTLRTRNYFHDIIHHKGKFYAVAGYGSVYVLEPNGDSFKLRLVIGTKDFVDRIRHFTKYLVESLTGNLMMLMRDNFSNDCYTQGFKVFILLDHHCDKDKRVVCKKWSYADDDMGDDVIFIGSNYSMSISASKFPQLRRNCIYFTEDEFDSIQFCKQKRLDMGLYDMGDKTVSPIGSLPRHLNWPPPVWFTPNIL